MTSPTLHSVIEQAAPGVDIHGDVIPLRVTLNPRDMHHIWGPEALYETLWRVRALLRTVARKIVDGEGFMPEPIDKTNAYTLVYNFLHTRSGSRYEPDYREVLYDEAIACLQDVLHRLVHKYDHLCKSQTGQFISRRQYMEAYFKLHESYRKFARWVISTFAYIHANPHDGPGARSVPSVTGDGLGPASLTTANRTLKIEVASRHLFARAVATTNRFKRALLLPRESLFVAPGSGLHRSDDPILQSAPLTLFEEVARNPECFPWVVDMAVRVNERMALPNAFPCTPDHPGIAETYAAPHSRAIALLFRRAQRQYLQLFKPRLQTRAALYELMLLQSEGRAELLLPADDPLGADLRVFEQLHSVQGADDPDSLLYQLYDSMVSDEYKKELNLLTYFVRRNMTMYPAFAALVDDSDQPLGWDNYRVVERTSPFFLDIVSR